MSFSGLPIGRGPHRSACIAGWRRRLAAFAVSTSILTSSSLGLAREQASTSESAPQGRPTVVLEQLTLPEGAPNAGGLERHLRAVLKREARRAEWGAGRGSRIEYRFTVTELSLNVRGDVLTVTCAALGKLPRNRTAKSRISFGGAVSERRALTERVLEIVARGVITRLAEIERIRRGQLASSRVRAPETTDSAND